MIYLNHVKLVIILDLIVFRSNLGGKMETKKNSKKTQKNSKSNTAY